MTFDRAWVLFLLALPIGWFLYEFGRTRRIAALLLKVVGLVAIILALSEPKLTLPETKVAVAVLVDTSASVTPEDLTHASALANSLEKARGRHWVRVLPFARSIRTVDPAEDKGGWHLAYAA